VTRRTRKNLLTSKEKIVLHLLNHHRFYQDSASPEAVTQDGIAEAVGVGRNNVSRFLNELVKDDLIDVQVKHIKGLQRVRNVYFLSHLGFQEGLALKEDVESIRIRVIDFDGVETEEDVGRLNIHLPRSYSLVELASGVERGVFNCSAFHEGKIKEERRYVDYSDRKPAVRTFFGRTLEVKRLKEFINSETGRLLVVHGIAGIGKTTLLAKFAQEVRDSTNLFWYKVHEWINLKILLRPLAEFLSHLGRKGLERYLAQTETPRVGEVCAILENDLADAEILLIVDDVQKSEPDVLEFLSALITVLTPLERVRIIVASREIPTFYNRSEVVTGIIEEMNLQGLDRDSASKMLSVRSVPEKAIEAIYDATDGHPLFLQLIDDPHSFLGKDVRMFIEHEVHSKLDLIEKRILEIASVFRYPVTMDAFFIMEEEMERDKGRAQDMNYEDYMVDYDTLDGLLSKSLLQESMGRLIGMHDLIREFFYSRLRPRQRVALHRAASSFYLEDSSVPAYVEALYHSLSAGDEEKAIRIAAAHGRMIIAKGYAAPFAPLVGQVLETCREISPDDRMELLTLRGQIHDIQGDWDEAIDHFEEILRLASAERDRRIIADINRRVGSIMLRRGEFAQASEYLEEGQRLAEEGNDIHTLVDIFYDMGGLNERTGENDLAIEFFKRSRELAHSIGEEMGEGKALYGIGRVYENLLDYDTAIEFKKEALLVLEKIGDANETAKVSTSLGNDLRALGDMDNSLKYQEKAINLAQSIGDLITLGYAFSNAAASYLEMGVLGESEELIDRASDIFSKLDDRIMISTMHLYRGYLYSKKNDWEWAKDEFQTSLTILRKLGVPVKLSYWLYEIGQVYLQNNDDKEAIVLFEEALDIATKMNHENLTKDLMQTLEIITS
jgi:tetratricopeptide (TPR) repeat protein/AAA+ ATPase superfamily predicted ATPase